MAQDVKLQAYRQLRRTLQGLTPEQLEALSNNTDTIMQMLVDTETTASASEQMREQMLVEGEDFVSGKPQQ